MGWWGNKYACDEGPSLCRACVDVWRILCFLLLRPGGLGGVFKVYSCFQPQRKRDFVRAAGQCAQDLCLWSAAESWPRGASGGYQVPVPHLPI